MLDDLSYGRINKNLKLDTSIRNELEQLLKPNPQRALFLQIRFEQGFKDILPRIWFSLSYLPKRLAITVSEKLDIFLKKL